MSEALGLYVHRFVPSPSGAGARTLLLLHGTGGDENDLLPLGPMLDPEAALLSLRGNVLEHGMPRFFRRLSEGVFDLEDLARRTDELAEFLEAAATRYGIDRAKLVAVGYSNGANIAASVLLRKGRVMKGAVLFRAMVPFEPGSLPDLTGARALISSGQADPIVPQEHPERLAALLRQGGADVTLEWTRAGHELGREEIIRAAGWLAREGRPAAP
jgi:predicted esterase